MRDVGLAVAGAVVAHRRQEYDRAATLLWPVRDRVRQIGGSHAQRDVFDQLLIDAAWRGGDLDRATALLTERTDRRPMNRWGWKHRALIEEAQGEPSSRARSELNRLKADG
jgi:hypothetical protein